MRSSCLRDLLFRRVTPVRALMHETLRGVILEGPCLDLGAGSQSDQEIATWGTGGCFRADLAADADIRCDMEATLPFADNSFKTALLLNSLELVYHHQELLEEIRRVLVPGGKLHIWVPFLINVHNDPVDYYRYTATCLERLLGKAGFSAIQVQPQGGLALVIGTYISQLFLPLRIWPPLLHLLFMLVHSVIAQIKDTSDRWPLAYHATATK